MALDDFFKRQWEEQERKKEAQRVLFEKEQKEREAKEAFEKKLPGFFADVVDPAIQTVVNRFKEAHLDWIYANVGRGFRAARPTQRISRDFYVDFQRNVVQFHIFARNDSFHITVDVLADPKMDELAPVNSRKDYALEEFTTDTLLDVAGTAMETLEGLVKKDEKVIRM